jgi:hypothetical protein
MALWQFDLHLIPKRKINDAFNKPPYKIGRYVFDNTDWWSDFRLPHDYLKLLDSNLPQYESWSQDILSWGSEEGNRIEMFFEDAKISSIFIRVDVREIQESFFELLITFAQLCDCFLLLMEEMVLIEPELELLKQEIERSKAMKFVENPTTYFEEIRKSRSIN